MSLTFALYPLSITQTNNYFKTCVKCILISLCFGIQYVTQSFYSIRFFIFLACVLLLFTIQNRLFLPYLLTYLYTRILQKQTFCVKICIFFGYNMIKISQFYCIIVGKIVKTIKIQ